MQKSESILIVHSDATVQSQLQSLLAKLGYAVDLADCIAAARSACDNAEWKLAIADCDLPDGSGLALVQEIHERTNGAEVILLGDRRQATALAALRAGAADYLPLPIDLAELTAALDRAYAVRADRAICTLGHSSATYIKRGRATDTHADQPADHAARRRLAILLAHEINNPLTPIIAMAELLLEDLPPDHPNRAYVTAISAAAWRIHNVVRGLSEEREDAADS